MRFSKEERMLYVDRILSKLSEEPFDIESDETEQIIWDESGNTNRLRKLVFPYNSPDKPRLVELHYEETIPIPRSRLNRVHSKQVFIYQNIEPYYKNGIFKDEWFFCFECKWER